MDMVCIANWSGYVYGKENRADRGPKFACAQSPFRSKDFLLFAVFPLWLTATERDNGSNQKSDCVGNVIYENHWWSSLPSSRYTSKRKSFLVLIRREREGNLFSASKRQKRKIRWFGIRFHRIWTRKRLLHFNNLLFSILSFQIPSRVSLGTTLTTTTSSFSRPMDTPCWSEPGTSSTTSASPTSPKTRTRSVSRFRNDYFYCFFAFLLRVNKYVNPLSLIHLCNCTRLTSSFSGLGDKRRLSSFFMPVHFAVFGIYNATAIRSMPTRQMSDECRT